VKAYVSDADIWQKWVIVPGQSALIAENVPESVPLRIDVSPASQTPTIWDGEQSAEAEIKGVVRPARHLSRFVVDGKEQKLDTTLAEMPFSVWVRISRDTQHIALEAEDPRAYVRVLVPIYKQGRGK
jgi:hypothetical protein